MDTLQNLKNLVLDNTDIKKIELSLTVNSTGLNFSASYCENLAEVYLCGYTLVDDVSFKHCTKLTDLTINGKVTKAHQKLDLSECYNFDSASSRITYEATDNYDKLEVDLREVSKLESNGEFVNSANGTTVYFTLRVPAGCKEIFSGLGTNVTIIEGSPSVPAFVVFQQDKDKFEKDNLWDNNKSAYRRDYNANPVCMFVGQKIEHNKPLFYTLDGVLLEVDSSKIEVKLENVIVPAEYGTDKTAMNNYAVVSMNEQSVGNTLENIAVTAEKPGVADITVTYKGDDGSSISNHQRIMVFNPVTSISVNSPNEINVNKAGEASVSTTMDVSVNHFVKYNSPKNKIEDVTSDEFKKLTYGGIRWEVYYKDGSWKKFDNATGSGLSVTFHNDNSCEEIPIISNKTTLNIGTNLKRGEYMIRGYVTDNYKIGSEGNPNNNGENDKPDDYIRTDKDIVIKVEKPVSVNVVDGISITVQATDTNGKVLTVPADTDFASLITLAKNNKKVSFASSKSMPVIDGYTFKGWYMEGSTKKLSSVSSKKFDTLKNAKINAVYVENTYDINYKLIKPKGSKVLGKPNKQGKIAYTADVALEASEIKATIKANVKKGTPEKVYKVIGWTDDKAASKSSAEGNEVVAKYSLGQTVKKLAGKTKKNKKVVLYPVWGL